MTRTAEALATSLPSPEDYLQAVPGALASTGHLESTPESPHQAASFAELEIADDEPTPNNTENGTKLTAKQQRLVEENLGLAVSLVRKHQPNGALTYDNLRQEGFFGLCKAAQQFDQTRGIPFAAFATVHITGSIKHAIRDLAPVVSIPRNDKAKSAYTEALQYLADNNIPLTLAAVVERSGLSLVTATDEYFKATTRNNVASLDQPAVGSTEILGEILPSQGPDRFEEVENRLVIAALLRELDQLEDKRLRAAVELKFGLNPEKLEYTQTQITAKLAITQGQVSKVLALALKAMRESELLRDAA